MMLCTKECEVCATTCVHTDTLAQAQGSCTHEMHTQVHIYTVHISQRRLMSCVLVCMLTGISDGC